MPSWDVLWEESRSENIYRRRKAARGICEGFSGLPDKDKAYEVLHRLSQDPDGYIRLKAIEAIGKNYEFVPKQAWEDVKALSQDKYSDIRWRAGEAIERNFPHLPLEEAWHILCKLSRDQDEYVREKAAQAIGGIFMHLPDKKDAWSEIFRLTQDRDANVRLKAAEALRDSLSWLPDKKRAWEDIHRLASDSDSNIRLCAAEILDRYFDYLPSFEAWQDLSILAQDRVRNIRSKAIDGIQNNIKSLPNLREAWQAFLKLAQDQDYLVHKRAGLAIAATLEDLPGNAWDELHKKTQDSLEPTRWRTASILSTMASYFREKGEFEKAYRCLYACERVPGRGILGKIRPQKILYLYRGLGSYYQGIALLRNIKDTEKLQRRAEKYFRQSAQHLREEFPLVHSKLLSAYHLFLEGDIGKSKEKVREAKEFLGDNAGMLIKLDEMLEENLESKMFLDAIENLVSIFYETEKLVFKRIESQEKTIIEKIFYKKT